MAFPLKIKWCAELTGPVSHPPKNQDGTIYVRTESELSGVDFYALDARTGHILWKYETYNTDGMEPYQWVVTDQAVVVGRNNALYGLDRVTGQLIWQRVLDSDILRAIATDESRLYAASSTAYAIDPKSGETLWEWRGLPSHFTFLAYYDAYHSTLVIPADHFDILDAQAGRRLYQSEEEPKRVSLTAVPYQNDLIYGDAVVDITSGKVKYELDDGSYWVPTVISDTVYYLNSSGKSVTSWDLVRPRTKWQYSAGSDRKFISNFAVLGSYGYILANDDTLRAVSLADGKEVARWSSPVSSFTLRGDSIDNVPSPSLVSIDDTLYLSVGTNLLYALKER